MAGGVDDIPLPDLTVTLVCRVKMMKRERIFHRTAIVVESIPDAHDPLILQALGKFVDVDYDSFLGLLSRLGC